MADAVLVVEDEEAIGDAVAYALEGEGFDVDRARDGEEAIERARKKEYELIVLDLRLPKVNGIEVTRVLRGESIVPILMLTAKDSEVDRVVGLEVGADDYVTKPFSMAELVSRVRAILRRRELDRSGARATVRVGGVELDLARHRVRVDGEPVELTRSEFRLLTLLAGAPEHVFSRREIMQHLWQSEYVGDQRACDIHVSNIRRKIERNPSEPQRLVTVRGVGYRLAAV
jgi:two-component system, OmpR family, response regulator RegX3